MSASASVVPGPGQSLGIVSLRGRVDRTDRRGDLRLSVLTMPAPDEFSMPAVVEVRGKQFAGHIGEMVTIRCRVSGIPNNYKITSGEDAGKQAFSARNFLEIVE